MTFNSVIFKSLKKLACVGAAAVSISLLSACQEVFDSREDCVNGIQLRFVYDYHMEPGANAFPANVDCVDVFVFDKDGKFLTRIQDTSADLQSESYRMPIELEEGDYHLMVYGGMACDKPSFKWEFPSQSRADFTRPSDLIVSLPLENGVSKKMLHNIEERTGGLFYGTLDITVTNEDYGTSYTEYTVNLMKDTNNIQVILQEIASPYNVDYADYDFTIIDDNYKLDSDNNPIKIATDTYQPVYKPFHCENRIMGFVEPVMRDGAPVQEDESKPVQVGCAELSTSRLFAKHSTDARLIIKSHKEHDASGSDKTLVDIPLINYLAATRGFGQSWIKTDQEYLDRQSNWTLMIFLQNGKWVNTAIAVNDWIVRINDIVLDL